ncbi:hypothetical protein N9X25_07365 [Verrucomicrobiales bacterium]|nr:hypothetical protein [Verrucomicrobiales bacterium]
MKPHKRKNTPPRREQGEEHQEANVTPAEEQAAPPEQQSQDVYQETEQYPIKEPQYDPGQALVDPSMQPPEPRQAYADPNPAPQDHGQAYVDPNQLQHDPAQAFVDPGSAYDPNAGVPGSPPVGSLPPVPHPGTAERVTRSPQRKMATSGRGPRRRPSTKRASSRYQKPKPSYGGGISVMDVFLFLVACAMIVVIVMVVMPKDLSGLKGHPVDPLLEKKDVRNLLAEGQKIMVERKQALEISEAEVNKYLNVRLQGDQEGIMSSLVKFKGAYFDFSPDLAEVIIERELLGMPITMTSRIRPEKFQRQVIYRNAGWSIGKIDFTSRNIKPIIDMFVRMRIACKEEYDVLLQMNGVRFEQDKVILDPVL